MEAMTDDIDGIENIDDIYENIDDIGNIDDIDDIDTIGDIGEIDATGYDNAYDLNRHRGKTGTLHLLQVKY